MENHSALESSLCLVAGRLSPEIKFSADAVTRASELCLDASRQAVIKICEKLTYKECTKNEIKELYDSFFGELNSFHPFRYANQIGFDATEVQITKGIVYFIDPATQGEKGTNRLKEFLRALLDNHPKNNGLLESLRSAESYGFQVKAEFPTRSKRADIFLSWKNGDELFGVIVEAKFGHQVTTGQLPTYREFIRKNVNPTNNYALILLTYTGEKDTRNQEWQPKSWVVLMTHWERNLAPFIFNQK